VRVLTGHLGDMLPAVEFGGAATGPELPESLRAVLETRIALRYAAQALRRDTTAVYGPSPDTAHPASWHLARAGDQLTAARDLMHTHFATTPEGIWRHTSPWAAALKSSPVNIALLAEIGGIATQLAPWTAGISLASPASSDASPPALYLASKRLWKAGNQAEAFTRNHPDLTDGQLALAAIPANLPPPRRPVTETETIAELCIGATASTSPPACSPPTTTSPTPTAQPPNTR
jgi:hypothetical protein